MEADLLLQAIEGHLRPKVEAAGGTLAVADNPWDVSGLLKISPATWRCILSWDDEQAIEDQCRGGWVLGTLSVFVQTHRGLEAQPGLTIHKESPAGRTSVTRRVAQVRRWLRAIQFEAPDIAKDDFSHLIFKNAAWIEGEGEKAWRCRRLDFELAFALDDPSTDPDPDGDNPVFVSGAFTISGVSEDGGFYLISSGGQTVGRLPRLESDPADPAGTGSGWRISGLSEDGGFYLVTLSGVPNGRVSAFSAE